MAWRSAILDLNAVRSTLEELLTDANVVLLGYRPGSLARFGLEPDDLLDRHPHLVVASLTAWGEHGPWSSRSGFDSILQAASGIAVACGSPEQPDALPVQALDHSTGYLLATHVMKLLADAHAGIARASHLGAARTLLNRPSPPPQSSTVMDTITVTVGSPHGRLDMASPPLTMNGQPLAQPVGGYGQATATWATSSTH